MPPELHDFTPLPRDFYQPGARVVAPRLLGHWLIRRTPEGLCGGPIVETEAYTRNDPACHAFRGRTERNRVMWEHPGHAYVYLIYGFYYCFNTVCRPHGQPEAVLVRAIEAHWGLDWMLRHRPVENENQLTSGPGKLCVALQIKKDLDGADICDPRASVVVAANPRVKQFRRSRGPIIQTTRIGIQLGAELPFRFYLDKSPFVSKRVARPRIPASS